MIMVLKTLGLKVTVLVRVFMGWTLVISRMVWTMEGKLFEMRGRSIVRCIPDVSNTSFLLGNIGGEDDEVERCERFRRERVADDVVDEDMGIGSNVRDEDKMWWDMPLLVDGQRGIRELMGSKRWCIRNLDCYLYIGNIKW